MTRPLSSLAEDLELCRKATPGPWTLGRHNRYRVESRIDEIDGFPLAEEDSAYCIANCWSGASAPRMHVAIRNAAFIAAARERWPIDIQTILDQKAEIERLMAELDHARECLGGLQ